MRACSSTPPKQNQDFVKEHNRIPLIELVRLGLRNFCAINRNTVSFSISASNDYENTIIEIKRLLRPIPPPFQWCDFAPPENPNFTCKSVKSCTVIRFIHVFKSANDNLHCSSGGFLYMCSEMEQNTNM